MASFIRPNRTEVNRTFPWLGFTIRTAAAPAWFEVAIATDPSLFDAEAKSRRTPETFYSTRAAGALPAPSGEAVWIVPPAVLARFAGSPKIYYALATFRSADRQAPEIVRVPATAAPSVALSKSFTGVTRRLAGVGGRSGDAGPDYGSAASTPSLEWAGDTALATPAHPEPAAPAAAPAQASALDFTYSDGLGPLPPDPHREREHHRYPSQALGDAIDIFWDDVELVAQPTGASCWAAAAAMLVGWRDRVSINPSEFWSLSGHWAQYRDTGLSTNDNDEFAAAWGLEVEPPQDYSVDGFRRLLETTGPLWIGRHPTGNAPNMGHAVCVIGLTGDGTPGGTYVHWHDPWPPNVGSANRSVTYAQFMQEFDDFVTQDASGRVNNQILRAHDTGGRSPGRFSAAQSFGGSRAMSDEGGGAGAELVGDAIRAIGGYLWTRITRESAGIQFDHLRWPAEGATAWKYPDDDRQNAGTAAPDRRVLTIAGPRVRFLGLDEVYSDVSLSWEYDGRAISNVQVETGAQEGDQGGGSLRVRCALFDEAGSFVTAAHPDPTAAGMRLWIQWEFHPLGGIGGERKAEADVIFLGNGTAQIRYRLVQGDADSIFVPQDQEVVGWERRRVGAAQGVAAMDVADVAERIGRSIIERFANHDDHIDFPRMSWPATADRPVTKKYPFDDPQRAGTGGPRWQGITIKGPVTALEHYCEVKIGWDYNGAWLTNVDIDRGDTNGPGTLHVLNDFSVTPRIEDVPGGFVATDGDPPCAALRVILEWRETAPGRTPAIARARVMLYGNGEWDLHWDQQSGDFNDWDWSDRPSRMHGVAEPAAQGLAATNGAGALQVAEVASAIVGAVVTRILDNEGDVHWELDQMRGMKYPNDDRANAGPEQIRDVRFDVPGPHASTVLGHDEIYADFRVECQVDGRAVGNVRVTPIHTNDAVGEGLTVKETVMDDQRLYTAPGSSQTFAAMKLQFHYRFDNPVWADIIGITDVTLYGNGDYAIHYETTQAAP